MNTPTDVEFRAIVNASDEAVISIRGQLDKAKAVLGRLEDVEQEAFALTDAIRDESGKCLARLYFDPIDEKG